MKYTNKIQCWVKISQKLGLTEKFIEKHQNEVHLKSISYCQTLSEPFIEKFKNKVNWEYIFQTQNLSQEFREKWKHKL